MNVSFMVQGLQALRAIIFVVQETKEIFKNKDYTTNKEQSVMLYPTMV